MLLLAVGVQSACGFALYGPLANGGDSWQTPTIGYGLAYIESLSPGGPVNLGDIGGPKNIAEGYRRNTPIIYYSYDANYLGYFGSNGAAASDSAFAIMNKAFTTNPVTGQFLTNGVDSYSAGLVEYPPETLHINFEAQSLALTDLKSVTLHCLVEQLGLAEPERFTWTLAERDAPPGCPLTTLYLVVQRNFGINASALNQLQYSSYVNDTLYTYYIVENCAPPNPVAYTVPYNVDPYADVFTAVAANNADGLGIGGYYAGLTRDDVAGLRYLLSTNNIAWETAAFIGASASGNSGAGAADLLTTNNLPQQLITTQPLGLLLSAAQTTDPATLALLYPGLAFTAVTTNIQLVVTTNFFAYYTNQPGPDVTNYAGSQLKLTEDLGLLLRQAATNDPATLESLYPGLMVSTVTNDYSVFTTTNITASYTNQPGPDVTNFLTILSTNTTSDLGLLIQRSAIDDPATLLSLYPGLLLTTVTNVGVVITTNITAFYTNQPFVAGPGTNATTVTNYLALLSTNTTLDLGLLIQRTTNDPATLQSLYPGLVFSTVTNQSLVLVTNITAYYTNQPGPDLTNMGTAIQLNPPPNTVPPPITHGTIDFGLLTLQALTNSTPDTDPATAIAQLEALYPNPGTANGLWVIAAIPNDDLTEVVTTNFITTFNIPTGQPYPPALINQVTSISGLYTNYVQRYTYVYGNVMLDSNGTFYPFVDYNTSRSLYGTNQIVTIQTTSVSNLIGAPVGSPQMTNTTTAVVHQYGVTGDFFILPTNWCGFTIKQPLAITVLNSYSNTITATGTTNNVPGTLTNAIAQWSQTSIYTYTNHQFQVWPGVCEPILQFATNVTTNVVITYQNTPLNVYTNNYFPTSPETVLTTNIFTTNGAPWGTLFTNSPPPPPSGPPTGVTNITVPVPAGDFFFIPTNWCGFQIIATQLMQVVYSTNTTLTAGPAFIFSAPGVVSAVQESFSQTIVTSFTNHNLVIRQGICEPLLQFATNYTTNVVITYQNTLLNVYTNSYFATSVQTLVTTNIYTTNGALAGTLYTNGTPPVGPPTGITNITVPVPTGDFFLIPTNWCGFQIVTNLLTSVVYTTNTPFGLQAPLVQAPGAESFTQAVVTSFTNHALVIRQGVCEPVLIFYTNYTTDVHISFQNTLLNVYTNFYSPSNTVTLVVTNIYTTNGALAGTLVTNITSTTLATNLPQGDFFIIPTNWCGFRIISELLTNTIFQTNTTLTATIPPGVPDIGEQYSQTLYSQYTNHLFVIQPGFCVDTLAFGTNYTTNFLTTYQYTFGNIYTNFYSPTTPVTLVTTNIFATNGALFGVDSTNITTTNFNANLPQGDFFIIPANWCGFSVISNLLAGVTYATNFGIATDTEILLVTNTTIVGTTTNVTSSTTTNVQQYSETLFIPSTNYTLLIQPLTCSSTPFVTGLRPGIGRIQFVRANYDSLLGQFFQPITNNYTMTMITNSQLITQFFQRMVLAPDILLSAANDIAANTFDGTVTRNITFDTDNVGAGLAGPGTINPRTTIVYNKVGNAYENGYPLTALDTNVFVLENSQLPVLQWASFDGSTNDPVLYPNGTSIANLQNQILIQVSPPPPTLPDGTNGMAYPATTFTASGGAFRPSYTWSLASGSQPLPTGLYWTNSAPGVPNDTIAGTPTNNLAGPFGAPFDFTIQLTDSLGRSVNWNYTITIH